MKVNFNIIDNFALDFEGRHIDLHNNFDFVGFDYNVAEREINLRWKKSIGNWVDKNELSGLVLVHRMVTFFKVRGQEENSINVDGSCLGEITFTFSASRGIDDNMVPQSKPNDGDDILYCFENGQRIRIHCEQIELRVNKDEDIKLLITNNESLVLFDFLSRFNESELIEVFEDQAEQKALCALECQLEKQLVAPLKSEYKDIRLVLL